MSLNRFVRQLKPIQENKVNYVDAIQNIMEAKGLNIDELQKIRDGKPRLNILIDVINNQTKVETTKGKTSLNFINQLDKTAMETNDLISAFLVPGKKTYKKVFVTDKGEEIKLNDILKTKMFGGGRGSGGGSENTGVTECAQCIWLSEIFNGVDPDKIDLNALQFKDFDIDESITKIQKDLTDDWISSSVKIAQEMKKNMTGQYIFHRGSQFVQNINQTFSYLNKLAKPKPFANVNKWSPADIWCQRKGFNPDLSKYGSIGEFNNDLKEMYDKGNLVGVSLKKVTTEKVPVSQHNTTGFIRRPVRFVGFTMAAKSFWESIDAYVNMAPSGSKNILSMQLRTFGDFQWQANVKGLAAAGGKIGGGVILNTIASEFTGFKIDLSKIKRDTAFVTDKNLSIKVNTPFLTEFFELYQGLMKSRYYNKGTDKKSRAPLIKDYKTFEKQFKQNLLGIGGKTKYRTPASQHNWLYSKYISLKVVQTLLGNNGADIKNDQSRGNKAIDGMLGYAMSESKESAAYIKYGK